MIASNMSSVPYTWQATVSDLGLASLQNLKLQGVMPHMHKLGHTYSLRVMDGASDQCGIDVKQWDIMWQRLYFYQTPFDVSASTQFQVTCDYNTMNVPPPILPGWGTSNEMCLAVLYFTADVP
jgi:hypothetical protein